MTKFIFKYAKAPTDRFTSIALKDIIDVVVEFDPKDKNKNRSKSNGFGFFSDVEEEDEGYNFTMKTAKRDFRWQAMTKADQLMWLRALNILFELRGRVSQNLKTTIDINTHLGVDPTLTI